MFSAWTVQLPPHLKANIVDTTTASNVTPGTRRWPIHINKPLSDILPLLVLKGRVLEACSNIVYHLVKERQTDRHLEWQGLGRNDGTLTKKTSFSDGLGEAMHQLFSLDYNQPEKEQIFAILDPEVLRTVSPKLNPEFRKVLRNVVTAVFRKVLVSNPSLLANVNFDSVTLALGVSRIFPFMEHIGIPVVEYRTASAVSSPSSNLCVSARDVLESPRTAFLAAPNEITLRIGERSNTRTSAGQSTTPQRLQGCQEAQHMDFPSLLFRLSPSSLDAIFSHYLVHYPSPSGVYCCLRLTVQLMYAEYHSVTQVDDSSHVENVGVPPGYFRVFSIESLLGGSSWSIAAVITALIDRRYKESLFFLLRLLPSANLFLESLEFLKRRDSVTGRPVDRWAVHEAIKIVDIMKQNVAYYNRYQKGWLELGCSIEEHLPVLEQILAGSAMPPSTMLHTGFLKERIAEFEDLLQGEPHASLLFSSWMGDIVARHSGGNTHGPLPPKTAEPSCKVEFASCTRNPVSLSVPRLPEGNVSTEGARPGSAASAEQSDVNDVSGASVKKQVRRFTRNGTIEALYEEYTMELLQLQPKKKETVVTQQDAAAPCSSPLSSEPKATSFYASCAPLRDHVERQLGFQSSLSRVGCLDYNKFLQHLRLSRRNVAVASETLHHKWVWPFEHVSAGTTPLDAAATDFLSETSEEDTTVPKYCSRSVKELEDPKILTAAAAQPVSSEIPSTQNDDAAFISLCWGRTSGRYSSTAPQPWLDAVPLYLPLYRDQVHVVSTSSDLVQMIRHFASSSVDIVGIDTEWSPPTFVSLLSLACPDRCFIIDVTTLVAVSTATHHALVNFMLWLLGHRDTLKICYQFHVDITRLFAALVTDTVMSDITESCNADGIPLPLSTEFPSETGRRRGPKSSVRHVTHLLANSLRNVIDLKNPRERRRNGLGDCNLDRRRWTTSLEDMLLREEEGINGRKPPRFHSRMRRSALDVSSESVDLLHWPSLGHMVQSLFPGYTLERTNEFLNWNRRPLEEAHLQFAALDALILPLLETALRDQGWMPSVILGKR